MMKFYISEGAVWILLVFYTPLVLLALWLIWRRLTKRMPIRISVTIVLAILAAMLPLWDVVTTSSQMAQLCHAAGSKIYKTVHVDGFYTNFVGSDAPKRGFLYAEEQTLPNEVTIYSMLGNKVQRQVINTEKTPYSPKSRYEFIDTEKKLEGYLNISVSRSVVRDRVTGEELGYAVSYTAYPGWVDRNTIQLLGGHIWLCPEDSFRHHNRLLHEALLAPSN